ncbi:MAG: hypothetical protein RML40_07250 [Bacteroidota bacterium]|nr:hypothetical protein [Candidatus Kapabacteria bacterium]MDW8220313.1 hypothetical protein [Bacteroidota bacterium]
MQNTSPTLSTLERTATPAFWGIVQWTILGMLILRFSVHYNSPYLDECDYIFVGRVLLSGESWTTKTYMFSSDMHLYVYGIIDRIFSHEHSYIAARVFAGFLGLASLSLYYVFVLSLYRQHHDSRRIAELSTLLFALTTPHTFISQFATYDIFCCFFFAAACAALSLAIFSTQYNPLPIRPMWLIVAGSVLFACAILAKYIALVYLPFFAFILVILHRRAALVFFLTAGAILGMYIALHHAELLELYKRQMLGTHKSNATTLHILSITSQYIGYTVLVALSLVLYRRRVILSLPHYGTLMVLSLPLLVYHTQSGDTISLYKHVVYTCFFLAPIAGEALYHLLCVASERNTDRLRAVAGITVVVGFCLLWWQLRDIHHAYPNTDAITRLVRSTMTSETTILSEDAYLFRYACFPTIPTKNLEEMTWFDNNRDGKYEAQDVIDAVWEGKFEYVYLNGLILRELGDELEHGILQRRYDLVLRVPYTNSRVMNPINTGSLRLYRRRPS